MPDVPLEETESLTKEAAKHKIELVCPSHIYFRIWTDLFQFLRFEVLGDECYI